MSPWAAGEIQNATAIELCEPKNFVDLLLGSLKPFFGKENRVKPLPEAFVREPVSHNLRVSPYPPWRGLTASS